MSIYSIKQLELISGIKAHTIRIWERRYGLFSPVRTATNIRKYNDSDVRLILNITLLLNRGYRISKVANKTLDEISKLTLQQDQNNTTIEKNSIEPLILATLSFNSVNFKAHINKNIKESGFNKTYEQLILPFFDRIGLLWQAGVIQTTHEHFATNHIKHLITFNYESLKDSNNDGLPIIFFLPEGEFHEISLLYSAFALKGIGFRTIYLGQSTPVEDVIKTSNDLNVELLFTSVSSKFSSINLKDFFSALQKGIPNSSLFVTGHISNIEPKSIPKGVKIVTNLDSLEKIFKHITSKKLTT